MSTHVAHSYEMCLDSWFHQVPETFCLNKILAIVWARNPMLTYIATKNAFKYDKNTPFQDENNNLIQELGWVFQGE